MVIELTPEKRDLLLELVDAALGEIGSEIRHTMTSSYKDDLKARKRVLLGLHELLRGGPPVGAPGPEPDVAPARAIGLV